MRFLGINLSDTLSLSSALSKIYGIGVSNALNICNKLGFSPACPISLLTDYQMNQLRNELDTQDFIELALRKKTDFSINKLVNMNCYRGLRHRMSLPVRGQRTHTNAKTQKKKHFVKNR